MNNLKTRTIWEVFKFRTRQDPVEINGCDKEANVKIAGNRRALHKQFCSWQEQEQYKLEGGTRKEESKLRAGRRMVTKEGNEESETVRSPYDGRASLSFMRDTSSYSATDTTSSMGQIKPYSSQPCSITRGSDLCGSNMMLLGVTISTPPTTPCRNKTTHRETQRWEVVVVVLEGGNKLQDIAIFFKIAIISYQNTRVVPAGYSLN